MATDICPECGSTLASGFCPRCLVKLGMDVPDDHGDTIDMPATAKADLGPEDGGPARDVANDTIDMPGMKPGLDPLATTVGDSPRIELRDTEIDELRSQITHPTHEADRSLRYRIEGEIARGGMGAVLKGRDPHLGRDVAIKVLLTSHSDNADMVHRFFEEAQIGGQLQHPGIVPIYELGTFSDRRPFFSMKLVKGQTLSELLKARTSPAEDLPRFLSIFAAIAQTMAYAHTRGVIHRDLKPANVMVGSFGEVQVMDWGLAKVMARDETAPGAKAQDLVATVRSDANTELSQAGSIMGTPSYMAPEQARGETDRMDERADVFAMGSILCEILTGSPAFTGKGATEIVRKAASGDTADALARLEDCGAEAELIAMAKGCLAIEREDRPRDANIVAGRITRYLAGVQERVQAAERDRAVAVAKAIEERRRRKVQLALAGSVLAFTILGGLSANYYFRQRAARAAALDRVVREALTLQDVAMKEPENVARWEAVVAAWHQAEATLGPGSDAKAPEIVATHLREAQEQVDAARRDQALLDRLVEIRLAEADDQNGESTDAAYAVAFREAGIDLASLSPAQAGARIKARPPSVATALAEALDDWMVIRRGKRADAAGASRVADVARIADPDPWRNKLRDAVNHADKATRLADLRALAESSKSGDRGAISLHLLGTSLIAVGDNALADSVLRRAHQRNPQDLWVNYTLGRALARASRFDEAIRFFTAARAIRPESAHELAHALEMRGASDEALDVFRDLKRLRPGNARNLVCMGTALKMKGLLQEADETNRAAVVAGRDEIRRYPDDALAHTNLGIALKNLGQLDEAIAEARAAIRLKPDRVQARCLLGSAHQGQGRFNEAINEYREAIKHDPNDADAHGALGHVLQSVGAIDESITECQTAIRLHPGYAEYHFNLGHAFMVQRKLDEAVAALREAIRLSPDHAEALCNLGIVLQNQGDIAGAVEMLRKGHRVGSARPGWRYPSAQWVAQVEREMAEKRGENLSPTKPKADSMPDDAEKLVSLHKRAHELASSKPDEAEPLFRQAFEGYTKAEGPDGMMTLDLTVDLANLLSMTGRSAEAEPMFRAGLEKARKRFGADDPRVAGIMSSYGQNLIQQGKSAEAEPILRECLTLREKAQPDAWNTYNSRSTLGGSLLGQKKYPEAEPLLLAGYEGLKQRQDSIPPPGKIRLPEAVDRLIELYTATNKPDEVKKWQDERAKYPESKPKPKKE